MLVTAAAMAACDKASIIAARAAGGPPDATIDRAGDQSQQPEHWAHSWGNAEVSSQSAGLAPLLFKARHSGAQCDGLSGLRRGRTDRWHAGEKSAITRIRRKTNVGQWSPSKGQGQGRTQTERDQSEWSGRRSTPQLNQNTTRSARTAQAAPNQNKQVYRVGQVWPRHLPTRLGDVSAHK